MQLLWWKNDVMSFINYMIGQRDEMYLQETPDWLKVDVQAKSSTYSRKYGVSSSPKSIRNFLLSCYKGYLDDPISIERDEENNIIREVRGVDQVLDPMLLEETIRFNKKEGNFDRIIAASLAVALAEKMKPLGLVSSIEDPRFKRYFENKKSGQMFSTKRTPTFSNKKLFRK